MLAGVLHGGRDLRVENVAEPELQPGQVLLRVCRAGICGTDVHYFLHGRCGRFVPTRPFVLGHEFVAVVEQAASGVDGWHAGDRVVVNPAHSCGQCEACRTGRGNLCDRVVMLGSASTTPPVNGAFAQYVAVSADQCYRLPEHVDDSVGAMVEPLSVALHAIGRAGGVAGARVLVAGAGPIGLITALAARAFGASLVVLSEPAEHRRRVAQSLAADDALEPTAADFADRAVAISRGGFDVVFEASGSAAGVRGVFDVVRRGATIVQIGTVGALDVTLPVNDLMVKELTLLGTFRYVNEFADAIRLLAAGRIDLKPLVTSVYPLAEAQQALEAACAGGEELKAQIVVGL